MGGRAGIMMRLHSCHLVYASRYSMLRFVGILFLAFAASLIARVNAQDSILTAYLLSAEESANFSLTDSLISSFWSPWQERDSVVLASDTEGGSQACIIIKSAATTQGLYLYAEVVDDSLVYTYRDGWPRSYIDGLGFLFDTLSSQQIASCIRFGCSYHAGVTYSSQELWAPVGSPSAALPGAAPSWGWCQDNWHWIRYYGEQLLDSSGIGIKWRHLSSSRCELELFVPWVTLRLTPGATLAGRRLAFAVVYDDIDADTAESSILAWPGPFDPWREGTWGDINLPDSLRPVEPLAVSPRQPKGLLSKKTMQSLCSSLLLTIHGRRVPESFLEGQRHPLLVEGKAGQKAVILIGQGTMKAAHIVR